MADSVQELLQAVRAKWDSGYALVPNEFIPWTQWDAPVSASKVALVSTGGAFLKNGIHQPFDTQAPSGDPSFREFPSVVSGEDIAVAHTSGDLRYAAQDVNVVFPLERLTALAAAGYVGGAAPLAYSFMGHVTEVSALLSNYAPSVAYRMRRMGADAALVVAAHPIDAQVAALVARTIELAGVPTVVLGTDRALLEAVRAPRAAAVANPAGAPLGNPGNAGKHQELIRAALAAAWEFQGPGLVADLDFAWSGE